METKGLLARWIMDLQELEFSVVHRAGRLHDNADALSRLVSSCNENANVPEGEHVPVSSTPRIIFLKHNKVTPNFQKYLK